MLHRKLTHACPLLPKSVMGDRTDTLRRPRTCHEITYDEETCLLRELRGYMACQEYLYKNEPAE